MSYPILQGVWTAVKWTLGALGGFAGLTKIFEWWFKRARIIGEVEQRIIGEIVQSDKKTVTPIMLVQYYLVNIRIQPTTIRGLEVRARLSSGEWVKAEHWAIPPKFSIPNVQIDFKSAALYDRIGTELLEYGKGVRGWIFLQFPGIQKDKLKHSDLRTVLVDAFGRKHKLKSKYDPGAAPILGYYPGAGMDGTHAAQTTGLVSNPTNSSTSHT